MLSEKKVKVLALQSPQIIINALAADFERHTGFGITQLLGPGDMPLHIKQKLDAGATFDAAFVVPAVLDQLINEQGCQRYPHPLFARAYRRRGTLGCSQA